jgi:hypothetical protein
LAGPDARATVFWDRTSGDYSRQVEAGEKEVGLGGRRWSLGGGGGGGQKKGGLGESKGTRFCFKILEVSGPCDGSALFFGFRGHVSRVAVALTFKAQTSICEIVACAFSSGLYISLLHHCQLMQQKNRDLARRNLFCSMFAPFCTFSHQECTNQDLFFMQSFLSSAVKLLSALEHRPNRMITIASLELALSKKIDLNISLAIVRPFRLFGFACHIPTKIY